MALAARANRIERLAPWLGGLLLALPVLIARYPPMSDLPLHEASVGLLRHWGDAKFAPPTLYFVNIGQANQLFSLLAYALSFVFPIAWATKLVVATAIVALPVAAAHLADYLGARRWSALLVGPLGLGWLFFWGLIQNILGLAALLAILPSLDRFAAKPSARGACSMCGAMLLLHFAHQAMQVVAFAALVVFSIGASWRPRAVGLRAIPVAFCALLVAAANAASWRFAGGRLKNTNTMIFLSLKHKIVSLSGVLFGGFEPWVRHSMLLLALVPVVLFVIDRRQLPHVAGSWAERVRAFRFEVLAATLLVLYFVGPATIKSTTLVYHRFLPPAWAIAAVCASAGTASLPIRPLTGALCAVLPCASLLIAWPSFADSNREYSDLDTLLPLMKPGEAVVALNLDPNPPFRLWTPIVAMGHIVAVHGGRSLFDYTQSPVSPVAQWPDKEWSESADRLEGTSAYLLRPDWDFLRYRYVLMLSRVPPLVDAVDITLKDDARLIGHEGDWYLFESTLPVVAIDAPDAPLPAPPPRLMHEMLKVTAEQLIRQVEAEGDHPAPAP